jgi:hypothetical protein
LKAERLAALPLELPTSGQPIMLGTDDAAAPEWVTYVFRTAHPILRWLPSNLAEKLTENMLEELVRPEKQGAQYTVLQLNCSLAKNLLPNRDGGHLRTFTTLQWERDDYRGPAKASCYPLIWMGIASLDKSPGMLYLMCYVAGTDSLLWSSAHSSPSICRLIPS